MRILAFGTYDTTAHPRVRVLLDGLRAHGHDVEECNVRLGLTTADRVATLQRPWRLPRFAVRVLSCWLRLARLARHVRPPDVVLVGYLGHFDVLLARRLFRGIPIVLDHLVSGEETASDRRLGGRVARWVLRRVDRRAVAVADLVLVDTEEHRDLVPAKRQRDTVVTPVGTADDWFTAGHAAMREREGTGRVDHGGGGPDPLRVVFFGLFTPLQGAPVIGAALSLLAGEPIVCTMVGHGQDLDATVAAAQGNDAVTWRRWVDPADLPGFVASHDVCLGIFGTGPKASQVVPTKVFQGLAARCVVVTSDTAPQRRLLGDAARYVPPGDAVALAAALRALASDRDAVAVLRDRGAELAADQLTAWAVTAPLSDLLARLPVGAR